MVFVEHGLGVTEVEVVLGHRAPRQVGQPLQVGAHHGMLWTGGGNARQTVQLAIGLGLGFVWKLGAREPLA